MADDKKDPYKIEKEEDKKQLQRIEADKEKSNTSRIMRSKALADIVNIINEANLVHGNTRDIENAGNNILGILEGKGNRRTIISQSTTQVKKQLIPAVSEIVGRVDTLILLLKSWVREVK